MGGAVFRLFDLGVRCDSRHPILQTASDLIAIERPLSHLKADIQVFPGNVFGSHTALRKGDWKIVREQPDQTWQLFDLARDLSESNDLASVHPQRVVELEAALARWRDSFQEPTR